MKDEIKLRWFCVLGIIGLIAISLLYGVSGTDTRYELDGWLMMRLIDLFFLKDRVYNYLLVTDSYRLY